MMGFSVMELGTRRILTKKEIEDTYGVVLEVGGPGYIIQYIDGVRKGQTAGAFTKDATAKDVLEGTADKTVRDTYDIPLIQMDGLV